MGGLASFVFKTVETMLFEVLLCVIECMHAS